MERIGSNYLGRGKCEFNLWAPLAEEVKLKIVFPQERIISMRKIEKGYWKVLSTEVFPGTKYFYQLRGSCDRPDPASHFQPEGVHGPSGVWDHSSFKWEDYGWQGVSTEGMIIYELHIGTFTPQGDFDAAIGRFDQLRDSGVNTLEIMPVAQFPGERNWGYDGVYPFAVQNSYGGPEGLKRFVNAAHKKGFSLILDVVYNHLGPEGNYLAEFGYYFTDKYKTPWGKAINYDGEDSAQVRNFFLYNSLYWFDYYHIDALRLDAVHGIYDMSEKHILKELAENAEDFSNKKGRKFYLIAESDLNDLAVIRQRDSGGYGIDAQWCDDFHHSLHTLLTGEITGYYADFGRIENMLNSFKEGFVYSGQYSVYRGQNYGASSLDYPARQFVVFTQNHDQVGNRMFGERLSVLIPFEGLKLAAGTMLVSAYIPLIFMGEEYAEDSPFFYFASHSDQNLIEAVRKGRRDEFKSFLWRGEPPDPQEEDTFLKSRLQWEKREEGKHKVMLEFYKQLIAYRGNIPALKNLDKRNLEADFIKDKKIIFLHRWYSDSKIFCMMNFSAKEVSFRLDSFEKKGRKIFDSSESKWMGPGSLASEEIDNRRDFMLNPFNFVLYQMEK